MRLFQRWPLNPEPDPEPVWPPSRYQPAALPVQGEMRGGVDQEHDPTGAPALAIGTSNGENVSTNITERVERGAALLDECRPGWWQAIDLERLEIASCCNCITGQIGGGSFMAGQASLGLDGWYEGVAHGFGALDDCDDVEYDALTDVWVALITRRREMARVSA